VLRLYPSDRYASKILAKVYANNGLLATEQPCSENTLAALDQFAGKVLKTNA
jgi:hypothetical protein